MASLEAARSGKKSLWIFPKYTRKGASSRLRFYQYLAHLQDAGFDVRILPLFDDAYLENLYSGKRTHFVKVLGCYLTRMRYLRRVKKKDSVLVQGELFPWLPAFVDAFFLHRRKFVLDFDDAVFHRYDQNRLAFVRVLLGHKIDRLMRSSTLVLAGNAYLSDRAKNAGAQRVEWLPTVVDFERYPLAHFQTETSVPVVGWIGTPVTWASYGKALFEELSTELSQTDIQFVVIGAAQKEQQIGNVRFVPWSEETETEALAGLTLGVMPLEDTPWARGKCGYKLIQYLACGIPVVASPVGANIDIVSEGENGGFATQTEDWVLEVSKLCAAPKKCRQMGMHGRRLVHESYSIQSTGPRVVEMLEMVFETEQ